MGFIDGIDILSGGGALVAFLDRFVGPIDPSPYELEGTTVVWLTPNEDELISDLDGFGIDGSGNAYFDTDPFSISDTERARVSVNPAAGTIILDSD